MTDSVRFNDKEYLTRDVFLSDYNVTVKISTEARDRALFDPDSGYASREAELIDELIYCYVPEELISASDKKLEQFIIDKVYGDRLL